MPQRRRLVLFVEGDGDEGAVPQLVGRLLSERNAWEFIILDAHPFRIGDATAISAGRAGVWTRYLQAAAKRKDFGGVLTILDGDRESFERTPFCAGKAACELAMRAKGAGAGSIFSVAVVFACQEYESWLIAGSEALSAKLAPNTNLEVSPRGAKEFIGEYRNDGYRPTVDQQTLTASADLNLIRKRQMRSFQRLEKAVGELIEALKTGQHVSTPAS